MGILAATLLPALTGLALLGLAPWLERRFGAATAAAIGSRAALSAVVLAILLLWQSLQQGPAEHRLAWLRIGRTTALDWLVAAGPLALLLVGAGLLAATLAVVAGLAAGPGGGARPYARIALAVGGALVLACAGTLWQAGIGVALVGLACRTWPNEHVLRGMPDRTWLLMPVALGLAAAAAAWLVSAGDLELATLERSALPQGRSELVRGRLAGVAPGVIAAVGLGTAALAWVLAWPRLLARAWAEGPAGAAVLAVAALPALAVVALRTLVPLALAPGALAAWTLAAAGVAAWAGWRAARASTAGEFVAAGGQVALALAVAAIGIGEPIAAARLLVVGGLASAAAITSLGGEPRGGRAAVAGIAAIGVAAAAGAAVAGLWTNLSAWSPGINALAPALALVGLAGLAAGVRHVLSGRSEARAWPRAEAGGLLLAVAGVFALAAALAGVWPLAERLWPEFVAVRLLAGAYAVGPRPEALALGTGGGAALVGLALAAGLAAAPRVRAAGPSPRLVRRGAAGATAPRLLRIGERLLARLTLWPGDERAVVAHGRLDARASLVLAAAGTVAILGSVYCNPDVLVLGPTRVHPVDLGGLDPGMVGARRAAQDDPASASPTAPRSRRGDVDEVDGAGRAPLAAPGDQEAGGEDMSEQAGVEPAAQAHGDGGEDMSKKTGVEPVAGEGSGGTP